MRYQTTRVDDAGLLQRMRAIAQERRRFGYRRLRVLLKREGYLINHKKLFRPYREEKLAARRRGGRKRAIGTRAPMTVPTAPNDRWSLDFVLDQLTDGRRFRVLTVVDDCTRECLALVADTSLSGTRVARELDRLLIERGKQDGGQRQRQRADQQRHPDMGRSGPRCMALHRAGQAHAECLHRELQRPAAGRIVERNAIHVAGSGPRRARMLAGRLQRRTTALAARMEDAVRVRLHLPSATGSGAALCRGLRASSRSYHRPTGQLQQLGQTQDWIKLEGKVTGTRSVASDVRTASLSAQISAIRL
jgi:hypothetical protein